MPENIEDRKWTIQSIGTALAIHVSKDKERDKKTDDMYKILVVGNGEIPLPETVRGHTAWIEAQKKKDDEGEKQRFEVKKGVIFLAIGQTLTLIVGALAVYFKK
jgi:hypothetical protein